MNNELKYGTKKEIADQQIINCLKKRQKILLNKYLCKDVSITDHKKMIKYLQFLIDNLNLGTEVTEQQ